MLSTTRSFYSFLFRILVLVLIRGSFSFLPFLFLLFISLLLPSFIRYLLISYPFHHLNLIPYLESTWGLWDCKLPQQVAEHFGAS